MVAGCFPHAILFAGDDAGDGELQSSWPLFSWCKRGNGRGIRGAVKQAESRERYGRDYGRRGSPEMVGHGGVVRRDAGSNASGLVALWCS